MNEWMNEWILLKDYEIGKLMDVCTIWLNKKQVVDTEFFQGGQIQSVEEKFFSLPQSPRAEGLNSPRPYSIKS